jgi:hypothetical protein
LTDWQSVIRTAANNRFAKTGSCDPFLLARFDLLSLCREIGLSGPDVDLKDLGDFIRVQARVYVPELQMQILVDQWESVKGER